MARWLVLLAVPLWRAFDAHIGAAHTIQFRTDRQQLIGAPYDERLYSVQRH